MDVVKWRLKTFMDQHKISAYSLVKTSGLAPNTVYSATRGEQDQVRLSTLAGILKGLRELLGHDIDLREILVHEVLPEPKDDQSELLEMGGTELAEVLDDLEADVPENDIDAWLERFYHQAQGRTK
jgi:DNA-binding Xre family transcriptional regulator